MAAAPMSIKKFKDLSETERKKINKDVLVNIILASEEPPEIADLKEAIKGLTEIIKDFKKESDTISATITDLMNEVKDNQNRNIQQINDLRNETETSYFNIKKEAVIYNENILELRKETEENSKQIVELKVQIEIDKNENRETIKDFNSRLNNLEQRSREKNLDIVGLRVPNEVETEMSLAIGFLNNVMKANLNPLDVEVAHVVPSRRQDNKRVIVVAFKFREKRNEVLKLKHNLRSYNDALPDQRTRIFVNEQLSPENRKLYAMAAKKRYELNYKFLWTKKGVCFLRKDENSLCVKIANEDDLVNIC